MLCGLAILTKAVAVLLIPAVLIALGRRRWRRFSAGVARRCWRSPRLYLAFGAFDDLWTWNVTYNREYASALSLGDRLSHLKGQWPSLLLIACATVPRPFSSRRARRWVLGGVARGRGARRAAGRLRVRALLRAGDPPAAALLALTWYETGSRSR